VTAVGGNPVSNGLGTKPIDHTVLGAAFEDQITPIAPATAAFVDDGTHTQLPATGPQPNALTFDGAYQVVFLAFPFEAYGNAADKATLMGRVVTFFTT
jgi:hypothetical protein